MDAASAAAPPRRRRRRALTVGIVAVVVVLLGGAVAGVALRRYQSAHEKADFADARAVATALDAHHLECGAVEERKASAPVTSLVVCGERVTIMGFSTSQDAQDGVKGIDQYTKYNQVTRYLAVGPRWILMAEDPAYVRKVVTTFDAGYVTVGPPPVAVPRSARELITLSGDTLKGTPIFRTDADWWIKYSFDCANKPDPRVGILTIMDLTPGISPAAQIAANSMGPRGDYTVQRSAEPGTHQLQVLSSCRWSLTVLG